MYSYCKLPHRVCITQLHDLIFQCKFSAETEYIALKENMAVFKVSIVSINL
jgi:hypothetical protein